MKIVNEIEEDMKILEEMIENANIENMDMNDCFGGEHIEAIEHILSDYKRALKENEYMHNELDKQQTKINKYAKENEEMQKDLDLDNEAEIALNNQIMDLQKENEKLHKEINERIKLKIENEKIVDTQFLPIQKIKDLKQEIQNLIDNSQGCMLEEDLHKEYGKIEACDELLEKGEE